MWVVKALCRLSAIVWHIGLLLTAVTILSACNQNEPATAVSPTPIAIVTNMFTATPTAANTPTGTPFPTYLPTATATPTAPPTHTPTATPTFTPTPWSTIEGMIGPDFADNINPLTGLAVNPATLQKRPLAIKISNAPAAVRPQAGLNDADIIFEHYAEAGLTRFTAIFYTNEVDLVGSIRSGRLIDLEIPLMYDAAFAYSGSSIEVREKFLHSEFFDRLISIDFAHGGFFRVEDPEKRVEHTLFTSTYDLRYILEERGENKTPVWHNGMTFRDKPIEPGQPARQIEIPYEGTYVTWSYYASDGSYRRWTDGEPHLDANTDEQVKVKNIVVIYAPHTETEIIEDAGGNRSLQIEIWGEGSMYLFRDGQQFEGIWRRADSYDMLTFYDSNGRYLPLAPGNTMFQIVPVDFSRLIVTPN